MACYYRNESIVQVLLDYGANVNIHKGKPLYFALRNKNYDIVRLLLQNGAKIELVYDLISKNWTGIPCWTC